MHCTHHSLVALVMLYSLHVGTSSLMGSSGGPHGPTVVVLLGPPGADGCSDPSAQPLPFEVPVVTNFPLSQLYCDCGIVVAEPGTYRLAGGGGKVLCVDGDTAGGLVWEMGQVSTRAACNWDLSPHTTLNGTLQMASMVAGGETILVASPGKGGGHHIMVAATGNGSLGGGLLGPSDTSTVGRFFATGVAVPLSRAVGGRGPGAKHLVLPTDDRHFKLLRESSSAGAARVVYTDTLGMGRTCHTPTIVSQQREWPPDGDWFFEFELAVGVAGDASTASAPLVTVGRAGAGISAWIGVLNSQTTLTVRLTSSPIVSQYTCPGRASWRVHNGGRVFRDGEALQGTRDDTGFADGATDSLLTDVEGTFAVSWSPHGCASRNTTLKGLRVFEPNALERIGQPMVQRCDNGSLMTCVYGDPMRPWVQLWPTSPGGPRFGALPPPFSPLAVHEGVGAVVEVPPHHHFSMVIKFELPLFEDSTPFRVVVDRPEEWNALGWGLRPGGPYAVSHGSGQEAGTLIAREGELAMAGDEFWCFGGDCSLEGVPFALCGVSPVVCVAYDHSTATVATAALDTNAAVTFPKNMGLIVRAHAHHAISRLEFVENPGTCLVFRSFGSGHEVKLAVDQGCKSGSNSNLQFIRTSELSNSDDQRMWLSIDHNILLKTEPVIAALQVSRNGTVESHIFPTQSPGGLMIRPGRQGSMLWTDDLASRYYTPTNSKSRVAFGEELPPPLRVLPITHGDKACVGPAWALEPTVVDLATPQQEWVSLEDHEVNPAFASAWFATDSLAACERRCELAAGCSCVSFDGQNQTCYMSNTTEIGHSVQSAASYNTLMHLGPIRAEVGVVSLPTIKEKLEGLADPMTLRLEPGTTLSTSFRVKAAVDEWRGDGNQADASAYCAVVQFKTNAARDQDVYAPEYLETEEALSHLLELTIGTHLAKRQTTWDLRIVHNKTNTTIATWPVGSWPRKKSTTILKFQWSRLREDETHRIEVAGRYIGCLVTQVGNATYNTAAGSGHRGQLFVPQPTLQFMFRGQTSRKWTITTTPQTLGFDFDSQKVRRHRSERELQIAVSCSCGPDPCEPPSHNGLSASPAWTWLAGGPCESPVGGTNTTLEECIQYCLNDISCLAARFALVMGVMSTELPCQLCTDFQPGPTGGTAMLIPMMHRCTLNTLNKRLKWRSRTRLSIKKRRRRTF